MEHLTIGIDVGNEKSVVYGFTEDGEIVVDCRTIPTSDEGAWRALFKDLAARYTVDACFEVGTHYEWMYDLLKEYCHDVVVVNASDFGVISRSQKKTDKIDAVKLAEGLRRGDLPDVYVPDAQTRKDRRLVAFVHWHSRQLGGIKGRIRSLLLLYRMDCEQSDVLGAKARGWIEERAKVKMDEQGQMILRMLLEEADVLVRQRQELEREVAARVKRYGRAAEVMDSIPGVGPLTILAVLSAIVDIGRFPTPEKLVAYFGACGSVDQSGKRLVLGSMTKRGNLHVRWLLSQVLLHLHRKDPKARRRYQRLRHRKSTGVARGAQIRWLTRIIWILLTRQEEYRLAAPDKGRSAA